MKTLLKIFSLVGLILTFVPSILVFNSTISMKMHFILMTIGMIMWFGTAPFWMKETSLEENE